MERSLDMRRSLGDRLGIATCLKHLVWYPGPILHLGHFERAERYARESLAIRRELLGAPGDGLDVLGWAVTHRGRYGEARSMIEESAAAFEDRGARLGYLDAIEHLSFVEAHLGRYERAREMGRQVSALGGNAAWALAMQGFAVLGAGEAEEAWRLLENGVALAQDSGQPDHWNWSLCFGGYAARGAGHHDQARRYFHRFLRAAAEIGSLWMLLYTLPGVAALLADQSGRGTPGVERAVEIYALAARYPSVANSQWFEDVAGADVAAAAKALPPEVIATAQERGRAAEPWLMAGELLRELEP